MGTAWFVSVSVVFLLFIGQCHGVTGCGGTYTETSGSFTSPGYPDKYGNRIKCTYNINTGSTPVSLTFKDFVTEKGFDYVKIYDANSTLRTTLAGSFKGFIVQPSSHLRVVFTTDGSGSYKGFKAVWIQSTLALSILPYSLQVKESSNLRVNCSIYTMSDQSSVATYKWSHDGVDVSSEAVLTRRNISRNQAGQYTCTASNTKGSVSVTVSVDVQYRPIIAGLPSIYKVKEESRLRIDCSTYTAPGNSSTTKYRWTYGGSTVSTGPIVDRSSIRRIQGGQYTCTASNTQGSASSSVAVDIQYAPTIAGLPSIFKVLETSHLKIDCSTYTTLGNPSTTSYGWTYGGSTVSTGAVLDRSSIRKSQAGLYTCTASNTLTPSGTSQQQGRTSAQVNVDVQYGPTIVGLPLIRKVKERTRLRIDCSTYTTLGNPSTTSYGWTYGGSTVSTGAVLYRRSIRKSQAGLYTCTASNTLTPSGTSQQQGRTSAQVNVDVQYGPTIVGLPLIRKVKERTRLRIDCSTYTTLGNPSTTSYGWTYGGSTVSTGAVLYRRSIRRSQAGLYTCTASNTLTPSGTSQQQGRTSAQVNVDVQYIDTPRLTFEEYEVQENDTVTLSCNVSSNPIVTMTVRRPTRGTVMVAKRVNSLSHTIQRARCLDTGTYTCSAVNTAGYNMATKKLNVLCPPRHDYRKQLDSVVISNKQRAASLVADIIANPRPSVTWHRYDGQVMSSVSGGTGAGTSTGLQSALQINITSDVDYGDYTVDVENSEGRARLTYTLSAASPPSAPSQVQALAVGDTSVSLQWVSGYNGGANQTFTMLYKSDLHYHWAIWRDDITDPGRGTQVKEAILLLTPNLTYQFHLYGVNVYGEGEGVIINTTTLSSGKYELAVGLGTSNGAFMVITILVIGYFVRRRSSGKVKSNNTHANEACDNMYTDPVAQMHCQVTELGCVYEPVETERMQSAEAAEEELYCNTAELFKGEKTNTHPDEVCNSGYTGRAAHHQVSELERVYVQFEMGRMQSAKDAEEEVYCNTAELNNESLYMNTL